MFILFYVSKLILYMSTLINIHILVNDLNCEISKLKTYYCLWKIISIL